MSRTILNLLVLLLISSVGRLPADEQARLSKPNIVLVMADDLGYECLGCNGSTSYRTPRLDQLARHGVRFTHCYAQPNCTPTRVQLMTGMSNVRNYVDFGTLDKSQTTFAHLFRDAGYATCIAGKWQLGSRDPNLPAHFGFDEHCLWAHLGRGERYANPSLSRNGRYATHEGKYGPDVCRDFVIDFMRRNRDRPFLIYYPMILAHGPYEPTPASTDFGQPRARGRSRNQRYFSDMVEYMDNIVGQLVDELETLGIRNNTLVLFTGDNGTGRGIRTELAEGSDQHGEKGSTTRGGMHVPLIASWPDKMQSAKTCDDLVDSTDFLPTLCEAASLGVRKDLPIDGRSFLPQLQGEQGNPRDWIYSFWVPLREWQAAHQGERGAVEQAFDHQFKLYSTGEFFNLNQDPDEKAPLELTQVSGEAARAAAKLKSVLKQFEALEPRAGRDKARRQKRPSGSP